MVVFVFFLICSHSALPIDWREWDPVDENRQAGKNIRDLSTLSAGDWGYHAFPMLANEMAQKNMALLSGRMDLQPIGSAVKRGLIAFETGGPPGRIFF